MSPLRRAGPQGCYRKIRSPGGTQGGKGVLTGASTTDILTLLRTPPGERPALYARADACRRAAHGDGVPLRGIVEFSNICANDCLYCGIRAANAGVHRYRMSAEEILAVARRLPESGQNTIVLQSGEAPSPAGDARLGRLIARLKAETPLAVTVSVGNRPRATYAAWRAAGMDRYLLRFETSDAALFARLHPACTLAERLRCLADLRDLGVQVGSGFMIGLPGETHARLAANIALCRDLDLDMVGIGPFIAHPATPLAGVPNAWAADPEMHFVAIAVLRLAHPRAHIPATTAFDALFPDPSGRDLALVRGANVFMPSATPGRYRGDYLLYPDKPCVDEDAGMCAFCTAGRIVRLGRSIAEGPGHALSRAPGAAP